MTADRGVASEPGGPVRLLLSAGRGPSECAWAVAELARRLEGEAAAAGVRTRRQDAVPGERPRTFRSLVIELVGQPGATEAAEALAAAWTGTLCWQAPSPWRRGVGRKNWFVTAQRLDAAPPPAAFDERDVTIVAIRTGGPGGQHRNKASTAVRATHGPSGHVVVADTERYRSANRRAALALLRQRVEADAEAARGAAVTDQWRLHDQIVRGRPVRTERPDKTERPDRTEAATPPVSRRRYRPGAGR